MPPAPSRSRRAPSLASCATRQGGVLPGVTVTVSGESLIGGNRTTVTGEAGSYQFTLPPGTYPVTLRAHRASRR